MCRARWPTTVRGLVVRVQVPGPSVSPETARVPAYLAGSARANLPFGPAPANKAWYAAPPDAEQTPPDGVDVLRQMDKGLERL